MTRKRVAALGCALALLACESASPIATSPSASPSDPGGWVESETRYGEDAGTAVVLMRVPAAALDTALGRIAALGTEQSRTVTTQDVTEAHADLETQLRNHKALRDRLRELAARAKNVKEVLEVETELSRVQSQVESLQGELDRLTRDIEMAQLQVTLKRKTIYGPLGYLFRAMGWGLTPLFVIQ